LLILLSSFSITSAWIYTETLTALGLNKQVVALVDASDAPICALLRGWLTERRKVLAGEKHEDWLSSDEGLRASSAVLGRFMRVASPARLFKFRTGLEYTLNSLTVAKRVAFYPDVSPGWGEAGLWNGFDTTLDYLTAGGL
jgi:hypothetical protein